MTAPSESALKRAREVCVHELQCATCQYSPTACHVAAGFAAAIDSHAAEAVRDAIKEKEASIMQYHASLEANGESWLLLVAVAECARRLRARAEEE